MNTQKRLLRSLQSFEYNSKAINESKQNNNGKIILEGIIQKADTLNQNGRVYPKDILQREVNNYQKLILENRATGECVPPDTEIYTQFGWKRIEHIAEDETVLTLDLQTHLPRFEIICEKVTKFYSDDVYSIQSNELDIITTPQHKILLWDENHNSKFVLAQDLQSTLQQNMNYTIHKTFVNNPVTKDTLKYYATVVTQDQINTIPYNGNVYCVTTLNGTWLMRRNGKVCWISNCDHPDSSVISLQNVSHKFLKVWMENNIVYGRLQVLNTPMGRLLQDLINDEVKLGISSRGVGSTERQGDYHIVQDDFQIICWDMVSEPSTPGAFMLPEQGSSAYMPEGKELQIDTTLYEQNITPHTYCSTSYLDSLINDIIKSKR